MRECVAAPQDLHKSLIANLNRKFSHPMTRKV
jgi:hypothetical protein